MRARRRRSIPTLTGFTWGPLKVTRAMEIDGRVAIDIETPHRSITVYASKTGRSLRVFKDSHVELLPAPVSEEAADNPEGKL